MIRNIRAKRKDKYLPLASVPASDGVEGVSANTGCCTSRESRRWRRSASIWAADFQSREVRAERITEMAFTTRPVTLRPGLVGSGC